MDHALSQCREALHLLVQVSTRFPVLSILYSQCATSRAVCWQRLNRVANERQLLVAIQPRSATSARSEELIHERRVDYPNDRSAIKHEGNRDTEHREQVGVVDCARDISSLFVSKDILFTQKTHPSKGSMIQVGALVTKYSRAPPFAYVSSPMKSCVGNRFEIAFLMYASTSFF